MQFTKVTDEERSLVGNVGQPDTPNLSTSEMQEVMDSLPNLGIDKFNNHIDELLEATVEEITEEGDNNHYPTTKAVYDYVKGASVDEIVDARIDVDEVAHDSLGDAIRSQIEDACDKIDTKITKPIQEGAAGQVLKTNGDGTTEWDNTPTTEEIDVALEEYFEEHPESIPESINGLTSRVVDLETQNGSEELETTAQTLSGAVNEIHDKLKFGFVTPEDFGAVGNGIADDTAAITEALTHPYVKMRGVTYRITETIINTNCQYLDGNNAILLCDFDDWAYSALYYAGNKDIIIKNLEINANNIASRGIVINSSTRIGSVKIQNCTIHDTNNKASQLNSIGICVDNQCDHVVIQGCTVKDIYRESTNQGVCASVGISVHDIDGVVDISNNIIDGVYYSDENNKFDADGIQVYAENFSTSDAENTSITISNNILINCQGRFVKIKSENVKVVNNTFRNEDIDIIPQFRCVDFQCGGGEASNNIMKIINCTGGTEAKFVKFNDSESAKQIINGSISNNSFYCDASGIMQSGVEVRCPNSVKLVCNIEGNQFENIDYVVYLVADAGITSSSLSYLFINNNSILGTYTNILRANASATSHSKSYINNNFANSEFNLMSKNIEVPNTVAQVADVPAAIVGIIKELGTSIGACVWKSHGTGMYYAMRSSANRIIVMFYYSGGLFITDQVTASTTNRYRITLNTLS